MKIIRATEKDFRNVKHIVHVTIQRIYPLYYPAGAVDFFIRHHSDKNIWDDIDTGQVYILCDGGGYKGTVTVRENEIDRLFVLPEYQDRGYGKALLGFAEDMIFQEYDHVVLAASFPAKNIGRVMMPISVQAHHLFVDGLHIGQFVEELQGFFDRC